MDIFTLEWNGTSWSAGEKVKGIVDVTWVERYNQPGKLTIKGKPHHDLLYRLELDTLLTHTSTNEVMIVEDVEIEEKKGEEAVVTITGKGLTSFFEHRVATEDHQGFDPSVRLDDGSAPLLYISGWPEYTRKAQIRNLIRNQIDADHVDISDHAIPGVQVAYASGMPNDSLYNEGGWTIDFLPVKRQSLLKSMTEALQEERWGIKVIRPYWYSSEQSKIRFEIHEGVDRRETIQFSYDQGDLEEGKYFKSSQGKKNALFVSSRYWGTYYPAPWKAINKPFDRKVGQLSASDVDENPATAGWAAMVLANYLDRIFGRRAKWALRNQEQPTLLEASVRKGGNLRYRKDYNVGDIVHVNGNFDFSGPMRVIEYVETFDVDGQDGYPVLEYYEDE